MPDLPVARYAKTPDGGHVAFHVLGTGGIDLLLINFWFIPIEHLYQEPRIARMLDQAAAMGRVIMFDRRGTGLSDPVAGPSSPSLEDWVQDAVAVLDAVGSDRAAVFSLGEGAGFLAMLLAATHPDRVSALMLWHAVARLRWAPDYPWGFSEEELELGDSQLRSVWSGGGLSRASDDLVGPDWMENVPSEWASRRSDQDLETWLASGRRRAASPGMAPLLRNTTLDTDVRPLLPSIAAPTLILHHVDTPDSPREHARYLGAHIPKARLVELPGDRNSILATDAGLVLGEIAEFLTGERPPIEVDRVLTTVMFTDIVGSTEHAAALGDHKWRSLLDAHDRVVRDELRRYSGREINTTGDGFLSSFDGPARAIRCGCAITHAVRGVGIEVRVGIHTGECEVRGDDLAGLAVHIAARVGALAGPGEVLVSRTVVDLVAGSEIEFSERGEHALEGVPGMWRLFAAED